MNDDIARRLQITTESIKTGSASLVVADYAAENSKLRCQLAAAKDMAMNSAAAGASPVDQPVEPGGEATTLVDRLRAVSGWRLSAGLTKSSALNNEAADEIERLRAVLCRAYECAEWHVSDGDECGIHARAVMAEIVALVGPGADVEGQ